MESVVTVERPLRCWSVRNLLHLCMMQLSSKSSQKLLPPAVYPQPVPLQNPVGVEVTPQNSDFALKRWFKSSGQLYGAAQQLGEAEQQRQKSRGFDALAANAKQFAVWLWNIILSIFSIAETAKDET
ncbi:uncharacterized protein V6R79_009069 [Siganus canaliculatus]